MAENPVIWQIKRERIQSGYALYEFMRTVRAYIMPPMPPMPPAGIAGAGLSSFLSAMTHSVVRNMPAMEAAFSSATRVTFAGSMTPVWNRCSYSPVRAL